MHSGRSPAAEQEFKEPKRKKKVPGVIPNNPFPIIFWKKLGIPPCGDLWPCYNGFYDGEGVVFPSSEDISDIHSMGFFGRNIFEDRGHDSSVRGIPVLRDRQWRKMVKWAADFGYVITQVNTEEDGSEDGRKENEGSAEKEDKNGASASKTRFRRQGNADSKGFDLEDVAMESNLSGKEEDVMSTSNESVKILEKCNIDKSGSQEIYDEEIKERNSGGVERKVVKVSVKECQNETRSKEADKGKEKTVGKEPRKEGGGDEEEYMDNEREVVSSDFEKEGDDKKEEMVEVVDEVISKENPKIDKIIKEKKENSIVSNGKLENVRKREIEGVQGKDEVSIVSTPVNSEKRTSNSETKTDMKGLVFVKEPQEKGKIQNIDDFVEIIEEKSRTETSENVNNGECLKKRMPKRRFEDELCNDREKRTKKDVLKCEDKVSLGLRSSREGSHKTLGDIDEKKCKDDILSNSRECEIVEINDRKSCRSEEWREQQNSETDDDVIVVSVDDGECSLDYASNRRRLSSQVSTKLPHDKYRYMKKNENNAIEIDLGEKEMLESEEDSSKCDDVEELYYKGSSLRNGDVIEEKGSTVSSLKSDSEISPCIVIPDSDSDDETERGPQWESDPSYFLPSLDWLKLFPEEAFFLAYALGCVQVWDGRTDEDEIKDKKQLHGSAVDSKSKEENSMNTASFSHNLKNSDAVSSEKKDSASIATVLSDEVTADKKVNDEKENISNDGMERNVVTTDVVNGNHRLSPDKPRDSKTSTLSVNEEKCSNDMNSSITVIDLVDSPPSHRHLVDKEPSGNDDMDPAIEYIGSKQMPESIFNSHYKAMTLEELWNAFRLSRASQSSIPFETSYAVYHHFRSKGWVVKPGIRFGGDFLLYKEGPSFYHASYLVVIDPSLPHEPSSISWNTLTGLNRLSENVAKELMICRVEWPESMIESQLTSPKCLDGLTVEEILVRRWVSMKERDADEEVSDDEKNCDFIPLAL